MEHVNLSTPLRPTHSNSNRWKKWGVREWNKQAESTRRHNKKDFQSTNKFKWTSNSAKTGSSTYISERRIEINTRARTASLASLSCKPFQTIWDTAQLKTQRTRGDRKPQERFASLCCSSLDSNSLAERVWGAQASLIPVPSWQMWHKPEGGSHTPAAAAGGQSQTQDCRNVVFCWGRDKIIF